MINWPEEFPEISLGNYQLRASQIEDKPRFIEMILGDPAIIQFTTVPDPYDESHADQRLGGALENFASKSSMDFVIADLDNRLVGQISLWGANHFDHFISVGYMLDAQYRGQGIMPRAISACVELAFELGFRRVQADVMVENRASQIALEKAGLVREARLTNYATNRDGSQTDSYLYAIWR